MHPHAHPLHHVEIVVRTRRPWKWWARFIYLSSSLQLVVSGAGIYFWTRGQRGMPLILMPVLVVLFLITVALLVIHHDRHKKFHAELRRQTRVAIEAMLQRYP